MPRQQLFPQPEFVPEFSDYERLAGARIGITGHRGVLGRIITARLQMHGIAVAAYPGDITDDQALAAWFADQSFDFFFHFAARVPVAEVERDPARAFEVNAIGAYRISTHLEQTNRRCWLFLASSSHVYRPQPPETSRPLRVGDAESPGSIYGRTKLAGEQLCRQYLESRGHPHCIGRIFSFSHHSQKEPYLVPRLMRQIWDLRPGEPLTITNHQSVRDIVDAETVIDCILYLARKRFTGLVNIGSGTGLSIAEIAQRIARHLERPVDIEGLRENNPDALVADIAPLRRIIAS